MAVAGIPLVELLVSGTAPVVVKYLTSKINGWLNKKIEKGDHQNNALISNLKQESDNLEKEIENKKENNQTISDDDIKKIKELITKASTIQKNNDVESISENDFTNWSINLRQQRQLESEDVALVITKQIDSLIEKYRGDPLYNNKRRKLEEMSVALKINLKYFKEAKEKPGIGLKMDSDEVKNLERVLDQSIFEAKNIIFQLK